MVDFLLIAAIAIYCVNSPAR